MNVRRAGSGSGHLRLFSPTDASDWARSRHGSTWTRRHVIHRVGSTPASSTRRIRCTCPGSRTGPVAGAGLSLDPVWRPFRSLHPDLSQGTRNGACMGGPSHEGLEGHVHMDKNKENEDVPQVHDLDGVCPGPWVDAPWVGLRATWWEASAECSRTCSKHLTTPLEEIET